MYAKYHISYMLFEQLVQESTLYIHMYMLYYNYYSTMMYVYMICMAAAGGERGAKSSLCIIHHTYVNVHSSQPPPFAENFYIIMYVCST